MLALLALLAACTPQLDDEPTALVLSEVVEIDALMGHLDALEALADANGSTRVSGTEGYTASVAYLQEKLEAAGYTVTLDPFPVTGYRVEAASLTVNDVAFTDGEDSATGFTVFPMSGSGELEAAVVGVDLTLPPGSTNSATSGCQADDFDDFPAGAVALIQRGSCTFLEKVDNAIAAGASAVLLFNEGQQGRTELLSGSLGETQVAIPVIGLSFAAGAALAEAAAPVATLEVDAAVSQRTEHNVLVETPGGDPDRVVMVGAHLDSVAAGPGVNDNGSGSALVLELALQAAERGWQPQNKVRFAWWGAEETGLVGSWYWVHDRVTGDPDPARVDSLIAYLNYDMVASGNGFRFVYNGGAREGGTDGSSAITAITEDFFEARGLAYGSTGLLIPSDSYWFVLAGVPTGGLYSGAMESKQEAWADAIGGEADAPLDACYHRACDRVENTDADLYAELAAAAAHTVQALAEAAPAPSAARMVRQSFDLPRPRGCHDHAVWDR